MTSIYLSLSGLAALSVSTLLVVGTAVAQVPDRQSSPDRSKVRQQTLSPVQQQVGLQADARKSSSDADRKVREMDRRLNRTLRSVCSGC
ncbi:hypothetical protein IC232_18075 [Microvirga sp. BT688]|uniref:hypothetical protein n=1 Tax=Microvirga sp. TaxID=1873136 RepID=UPI0016837A42|nr:hypothetical protein [Microvirga sp.]MBD2748606.1 hypothetical protein [Microvirga sp.]